MNRVRVEYRLLQYVLSHVGGDRVTVAVLHWDGAQLRCATAHESRIAPLCSAKQRDIVLRTVRSLIRNAEEVGQELSSRGNLALNTGLADLFRVTEGRGGALLWAPVVAATTSDAQAHFNQIVASVHFEQRTHRSRPLITNGDIDRQLAQLGEELQQLNPSRIQVRRDVSNRQHYQPPLSWKNGVWHHAIPISLVDKKNAEELQYSVRYIAGLLELALPNDERSVVVAALPPSGDLADEADEQAGFLCQRHNVELIKIPAATRTLTFDPLRARIVADISGHSAAPEELQYTLAPLAVQTSKRPPLAAKKDPPRLAARKEKKSRRD